MSQEAISKDDSNHVESAEEQVDNLIDILANVEGANLATSKQIVAIKKIVNDKAQYQLAKAPQALAEIRRILDGKTKL